MVIPSRPTHYVGKDVWYITFSRFYDVIPLNFGSVDKYNDSLPDQTSLSRSGWGGWARDAVYYNI